MKIRYKHWFGGDIRTATVSEYVEKEIFDRASMNVYGQVERLEAELEKTQEVLLRLIKLLEDDMGKEEIEQLCDPTGHAQLEAVEE